MSIEALVIQLSRTDNFSAHRFFGMGFALGPFEVTPVEHMTAATGFVAHPLVRVPFRCVCGRVEIFGGYVPTAQRRFNIFQQLEAIGSLSRKHLLEDGYSAEQIDAMERSLSDYMVGAGFVPQEPPRENYAKWKDWENHPVRHAVPARGPAWICRTNRVPPVSGLAEDFAVRNMRSGGFTSLPKRSESLEWRKGYWHEVPGSFRDSSVSVMPRSVRVGAAVDFEG